MTLISFILTTGFAGNLITPDYLYNQEVNRRARCQNCLNAAVAVSVGRCIWFLLRLLPPGHGLRLPLYKQIHVLLSLCMAHGLIADIFIFSLIFELYKGLRPVNGLIVVLTVITLLDLVLLVYYAVLQSMFARYLLTVWLATFQDDWSAKTHNRRWWILLKCLGGSTPDTSFQDGLVSLARSRKRWNRKPFRWLRRS